MTGTFKESLKRIGESRGLSYEDVYKRWESYVLSYMDGKFITPPNLDTFQRYYV